MMQLLTYVSIFLLSVVVPLGIFVGRDTVRSSRGRLVEELAKLFNFAREEDGSPLIVPSFELVKYKYDAGRDPIQSRSWIIPVSIYVVLTFLGFMTSFANLQELGLRDVHNAFLEVGKADVKVGEVIGIISYAFLGGYLWTIQYLIRRVANFDLKPLSFVRCAIHVLFGIFVSAAAWHASEPVAGAKLAMAAPLAFLIGMSRP